MWYNLVSCLAPSLKLPPDGPWTTQHHAQITKKQKKQIAFVMRFCMCCGIGCFTYQVDFLGKVLGIVLA